MLNSAQISLTDGTRYKQAKLLEMSSNESAPRDLHDDVPNITIASKKREIGDKIRAFGKQPKKLEPRKMVETFLLFGGTQNLKGSSSDLRPRKENKQNGTSFKSWADRNRRCNIALFLAIRRLNPALKFMQKFKWKEQGSQRISVLSDQMVSAGLNISGVWFRQLSRASFWEPFSQNSASAWI